MNRQFGASCVVNAVFVASRLEIGPIVHVWFMATDYVWLGLACSKTIKRNHVCYGSHQAIGSEAPCCQDFCLISFVVPHECDGKNAASLGDHAQNLPQMRIMRLVRLKRRDKVVIVVRFTR